MYMPTLKINLRKLEENARTEKALLASSGIDVMAVNKVFDGCVETAQAVLMAEFMLLPNQELIT